MEGLLSLCLAAATATTPENFWRAWSFAPQVLVPLLGTLVLYGARVQSGGTRSVLFLGGWVLLAIALVSPLCRLGATLVSAHMVQHVLLATIAPLLLVLGAPSWRAGPGARALLPLTALYGLAIWLWHFPPLYTLVLLDAAVHTAAYAVLIVLAVLFWSAVAKAGSLAAVTMLFVTMLHTGVLGALLVFSPRAWYPVLASRAELWGLSALEDQQLAGLIMWVPMSAFFLLAGLRLLALRLGAEPAAG